jgi:hypothetical protein
VGLTAWRQAEWDATEESVEAGDARGGVAAEQE